MKPLLHFTLSLILFSVTQAQDTAATLRELAEVYEESKAELMKPVTELQTMYATKLEELKAEATKAGQLERVLAIKSEADAFRTSETPAAGDDFPKLKDLQTIYRQALPTRLAQAQAALAPLNASYQAQLLELQTELTKQEKLTEALQVKAVLDGLADDKAAMAEAKTPEAALNLVPEISGLGTPTDFAFKEGRLHAMGRMASLTGPEVDLSPAAGITDFIDVTGNQKMWVALRKNGTAIGWHTMTGPFSKGGIRKLVNCPRGNVGPVWGISVEGQLTNLISGEVKALPGPVLDASIEANHSMALLEDGTVHVWGALYDGPTAGRQPMPQPPPAALKNISQIAATRYAAFVVTKDGDLMGWRHEGHVYKSFPSELKHVTQIWGYAFHVAAEVKGKTIYRFIAEKGSGPEEVTHSGGMIRTGNGGGLLLEGKTWKVSTGWPQKQAHGEVDAVEKMDGSVLPFLYQDSQNEKLTVSYLLWLTP